MLQHAALQRHSLQRAALRLQQADMDLRKTLFLHIVLSGGSTLFPGFGDRLLSEAPRPPPPTPTPTPIGTAEGKYSRVIQVSLQAVGPRWHHCLAGTESTWSIPCTWREGA